MIRAAPGVLALVVALGHLPFLASSLEDIDSVNFALGLRDFDLARHQPHPPGYPVYIALGKAGVAAARAAGVDAEASTIEARVLSLISLAGALACVLLLVRVLSCWSRERDHVDPTGAPWPFADAPVVAATALTVACPLFWYLAVRPMSDIPGLAAALASQAALGLAWWRQRPDATGSRRLLPDRLTASGRMIVLGSLLAGLAIGFRSQNAMLTLPLLAGVLGDRIGRGVAGALLGSLVALGAGVLAWAIPMLVASGGMSAYLAALGSQAGEDFAGVEMLYLRPSPRLAAFGLMRTFILPWDSIALGTVVVALAAIGTVRLLLRDRRALAALALVSVPYLAFHLLFQDTTFVRYALPLVPPVAYLAVAGLAWTTRRGAPALTAGLAIWALAIAVPTLTAYGGEASPVRRALAAMRDRLGQDAPGALAFHQTFRRPLEAETVPVAPILPSPPRREWLELVEYWRAGHTAPLWFLADPRRSDLALIDPQSRRDRSAFRWGFESPSDLGGMRPAALDWYRMPPPGWLAGEGWALTAETAGIARLMGRGPSIDSIRAWVRRRPEAARALVGGRHLGAAGDPDVSFSLAIDGRPLATWVTPAGFFVREIEIPAGTLQGDGQLAELTVRSDSPGEARIPTAIEQFDLQSRGVLMWAYGEGWHEGEYELTQGVWRWTSERAVLHLVGASTPVAVTLHVERPRRYFDTDPVVRLVAGDRAIAETRFIDAYVWRVIVPLDALEAARGRLAIETTETFAPADRGRIPDRRRLGLRVFGVDISAQP